MTLVGCGLTLKALVHFTIPAASLRTLAHVSEENAWTFRAGGFVALIFGLAVGWISLGAPRP